MSSKSRQNCSSSDCPKLGYVICGGCSEWFCKIHFCDHRESINNRIGGPIQEQQQFDKLIEDDSPLLKILSRIDTWETKSIECIHQTAKQVREDAKTLFLQTKLKVTFNLEKLSEELQRNKVEQEFIEIELDKWSRKLKLFREQLETLADTKIVEKCQMLLNSTPFLRLKYFPDNKPIPVISSDAKWNQNAVSVAGNQNSGSQPNQLSSPSDVIVDEQGTLYIADTNNQRIVAWKSNDITGTVVAVDNNKDDESKLLQEPTALLLDQNHDRLIISDIKTRCITAWTLENDADVEILIRDVHSYGLAMDDQGFLYISDFEKNEIRRYAEGEETEVVVAGGNGKGNDFNQLDGPRQIFIDSQQSIYISDTNNHRVMKWTKNANKGIVVAGGNGQGNDVNQLNSPSGIFVDTLGSVFVVDQGNRRVMRWFRNATKEQLSIGIRDEAEVVIGEQVPTTSGYSFTGFANSSLSFGQNYDTLTRGLFIDSNGSIYLSDRVDHRIQRFDIQKANQQVPIPASSKPNRKR